jgi:hypothetical protein
MRNGIRICKPTSITYSGTSASIVGQGSVEFSAVTSLSLNGVFSSDYDNYMLSFRWSGSSNNLSTNARLRASGADEPGSSYNVQYLAANGTAVSGARFTSTTAVNFSAISSEQRSGDTVFIYGPYLTQPTAFRNFGVYGASSGQVYDNACTHALSTSYDGLTVYIGGGHNMTGLVSVYGLVD